MSALPADGDWRDLDGTEYQRLYDLLRDEADLPTVPFPVEDEHRPEVGLAYHMGATIEAERLRTNVAASRGWEMGLRAKVTEEVERARLGGRLSQIAQQLSAPAFRQGFEFLVFLRASLLWPLSTLLYHEENQEVTLFGFDRILCRGDGGAMMVFGAPPEWDSDDAAAEWFRRVSEYKDAKGAHSLNADQPMAEFTFAGFRFSPLVDPIISSDRKVGGTIRIPQPARFGFLADLVSTGMLTPQASLFLTVCVKARLSQLFSGGMKCGKTTIMRCCCGEIQRSDVVFCAEDADELHLEQLRSDGRPFVQFVTPVMIKQRADFGDAQISLKALVKNGLRQAAQRLVVGEIRDSAAQDMVRALTSGMPGGMGTVHASDPRGAISTMTFYMMEGSAVTEAMAEKRVREAFDVIVQIAEVEGRRVVTEITLVGATRDQDVTVFERAHWDEDAKSSALAPLTCKTKLVADFPPRARRLLRRYFGDELPG